MCVQHIQILSNTDTDKHFDHRGVFADVCSCKSVFTRIVKILSKAVKHHCFGFESDAPKILQRYSCSFCRPLFERYLVAICATTCISVQEGLPTTWPLISSGWHLSVLCFCHTHGSVYVGIAHLVYFYWHLSVVGESCHTGILSQWLNLKV